MKISTLLMSTIALSLGIHASSDDPHRWLEAVDSEAALKWVVEQNESTLTHLKSQPGYARREAEALEILTAPDRIIQGSLRGDWVYNFWRSAEQPQGVWRRTSYEAFRNGKYEWQVLLDLDALSQAEGTNWVWKGAVFRSNTSNQCLIKLSDGGKDAMEVREYDLATQSFVPDGFFIPEAKTYLTWADEDSLWLATQMDADSVTESGYPRVLTLLHRGQSPSEAKRVYEADASHVLISPITLRDGSNSHHLLMDRTTFYESQVYLLRPDGTTVLLPIQSSDEIQAIHKGQCIVLVRKAWTYAGKHFPEGSLVSFSLDEVSTDGGITTVQPIFLPTETTAVKSVASSRSALLVNLNDNVTNRLVCFEFGTSGWNAKAVDLPPNGTLAISSTSSESDIAFLEMEGFLSPDSLLELDVISGEWTTLQSLPTRFDASNLIVKQQYAISRDGTRVPYFMVHSKDLEPDGTHATYLYGYGGFEQSMNPFYLSTYGKLWVEPGHVFVLANIRGGGEFGPKWHQAALKQNRQRAFDDFHAVAEDLINRGITSPEHLGIGGGSNGGLLVGVAFTQRPDLYGAVFCSVPLLDMLRYHELPPGASWIAEYGDPRIPEERDFIAAYSPYQNLRKDASYPKVFFYTSTRDDRVHPGHARKMAARMAEMGHPHFYFERIEGGHAGGANLTQYAELYALQFTYLQSQLSKAN
ncbi:MAG: prolyl oligopeptidase family serine peptidase [Puniceicoccaceae bacterium]